jgi:hypothetical protein
MRTAFCHYCRDRIALAEDGGFVIPRLELGTPEVFGDLLP